MTYWWSHLLSISGDLFVLYDLTSRAGIYKRYFTKMFYIKKIRKDLLNFFMRFTKKNSFKNFVNLFSLMKYKLSERMVCFMNYFGSLTDKYFQKNQ